MVWLELPVIWSACLPAVNRLDSVRSESDFLGPLDLHDPRIMHYDLHNTEAELPYLLSDQVQPLGWFVRLVRRVMHDVGENRTNLYYVNRDY